MEWRRDMRELSKDNPYYISKHRYLELKHFCAQYYEWENERRKILNSSIIFDDASKAGELVTKLSHKMDLVKKCCDDTDIIFSDYIFEAVTKERTFTYMQVVCGMPCSRDIYYAYLRRFFWILASY